MNKLQEYTASIPDSNPNKAGLIRQWKIENKWGEEKPEPVGTGTVLKNEETEEFKGLDLAKTIDVATTPASVTSGKSTLAGGGTSISGDGNLKLNEDKLDNEKEVFDNDRYLQFKSGRVYEKEYLKTSGGTTFDEYAKKWGTTPITPEATDVVLDEVVIKGKKSKEVLNNEKNAVGYIQAIDSKNEVTLKGDIGESYFDLTDEFSSNVYTDGELIPRSIISAEFVNNRPKKNKKTWYPETRMKGQYINSLEEDQKASMGETKWNQWQAIKKAAGDTVLTKNNIAEFIDLAKIDETTKSQVVNTAKNKAAELFIYDKGLTEWEQEAMLKSMPFSNETKSSMLADDEARKQDAIDYKEKTGATLVEETNLAGRIYKPFIFSDNIGKYDKIIADENASLSTNFELIEKDAAKFKVARESYEKIRSQYETKLNGLKNKIDSYSVADNAKMSPNEVTYVNSLITDYNNTLKLANSEAIESQWKELNTSRAELNERIDALTSRAKQLNDLNIGTGAIGKSYELSDQFAQVMEESFLGTSAMLGGSVFKLIGNAVTIGKTEDEAMQSSFYRDMKNAKMAAINYNARLQSRRKDNLPSRIKWDDKEAGWGDYASTMLVENSPSILTAMGTLGASSTGTLSLKAATNISTSIFFTMEAGGQMSQLELAQRDANKIIAVLENELLNTTGGYERREVKKQIQEQKDILSLAQWQKSLSSIVYGGTAAIAERFGSLNFINNFQKYSRAIGVNQFKKIVGNSMTRTLSKSTGTMTGIGMGGGIELLEEGFTLIGQNISDIAILEQDKNIFEGLDKDFVANTLATSMAISGPVASQSIYSVVKSEVMSRREAREESKMRDEIMSLQNEINGDKLTEEERKRARRKKFELMTELGLQNTEVVLKINDMTSKEFEDVTELNREMRALEKEAAQLGSQGNVSAYSQKELANLKSKYKELISQREDILERQSNELNELFPDKKGLSVNAVYNANLYNFAKNIIKNNKGTKSQNFTTTADAVKFIKENHSTWYSELSEGDKKDFDAGRWGGINIGNNIYMNQESVFNDIASGDLRVGQLAAMSPLHELGHIQTVKAGIIKDGKFVGDAQAMIAGVTQEVGNLFNQKKVSAKDYKLFQDRMAQYTDANTGQVDADELIQLIGDFTNMGILPRSSFNSIFEIKNFVSNLMKRENGEAEMYFRFNKPENVFGFVNSWTKKAIGGRQLAGVNDEDNGKVKLSRSQAQLEKTKQKFKDIESDFKSRKAQNFIAGELFAMVEAQVRNRFKLSNDKREEFISDVITKLIVAKETTKWGTDSKTGKEMDSKGDLYGFLNGRIALRIKDVVREEYKRVPEERRYLSGIDSNQFEALEKAAGIIAEETVVKEDNKPVFKKLISSRVISTEALVNIKNKVLSTVRTLKATIDSNTSVNKTVSPLIAEIKKEMGKQADIDLKKEMGGKKDDQLKKFLINAKKAILQNMTTTWLMTAMPGAVQKRVDGVWTSNWKGKKIDRESVKDNNAGRTSGADMVRRKPNVASMEDTEFLGYILDSKGNPLRGRKESLAKAMAEEISLEVFNQQLQDDGSDISKAFEQNQTLKGVELLDNYIAEVAKQSERGNVKFSKSVSANDISIIKSRADLLKKKLLKANIKLTSKSLLPLLLDIYPEMDEKKLKAFATEAIVSIQRYIKKIDLTNKVNFGEFIFEGISLKENNSNLLKFFGIQKTEVKSLGGLYNNADLVAKQRELEFTYNNNLVSKEGEEGLLKILRWGRGHQATSGKIGGGRNQSYAGNPDYIDNNLNNIPDVEVVYKKGKTTSIKAVYYKGIEIEGWKNKIKTPQQKAAGGIESFRKDAQVREDAAREAWIYLTDFLQHVKDTGNQIDWTMAMMSLKSSMSSVLKAAAPVKYHFEGTHKGPLRYEHMIPTEYMVLKLSDYYWNGKKFNLNSLRDKYNVAIIPITMDDNFNILTQSQMNSEFDPMVNSEIDRYFNETTLGYPNMFPIEVLSGKDKGKIEGKGWVAFTPTFAPGKVAASKQNNNILPAAIKYSKSITVQESIDALAKTDNALANGRKLDQPVKKIRVFDFDDTLARTKSNVLYTMPDGTTGKIDAATFAKEAGKMEAEGAQWDFSEFSKVMQGSKGPLLDVAKIIADKRGTKDVFVLTARPADAAGPIKEFLASMGLDIPLANITGLGDGAPQAKAGWIMGKAAEGYNDFYFADDHTGNVKAVKDVLSQLDVKSKVQQAKFSKSINFDKVFNDIIESSTGIESYKEYSSARAKTVGANKGKFTFFIPPSAEDFLGLLYKTLGKGRVGDAQMAFYKENLLDPYNRAEMSVTQAKIAAAQDFKALKSGLKTLPKTLSKETGIGGFTYSHAVRVAVWTAQGMDIPGLSKRDIAELNEFVNNDPKLKVFAQELIKIQKDKPYPAPPKEWLGGNITTDIVGSINKVNRKEYLQEWQENVDIIFSDKNMNKLEATFGPKYVEALKNSLGAMKSGSNRPLGTDRVTSQVLDWLNNSVGVIMFLNTRSAVLQVLSAVNFINFGDNNIVAAGKAFANQPQFWKDFKTLMNSPYLLERRDGLKINVSESEIADAVAESKNKAKAAIAYLLNKGFVMTRIADSFAIASGGSTFYRNRINALVKSGMDVKAAEAQAMKDFYAIAETNQQSSNPSKISQQQRSTTGRVILAFGNTAMQYARIQKRAIQDIGNRRGDWKTNVSRVVYYGVVQNLVFTALQQALFADLFEDEDEDKNSDAYKTKLKTANSMLDNLLRGIGIGGAITSTVKNSLIKIAEEKEKKRPDFTKAVDELFSVAPPLQAKWRNMNSAAKSASWNMEEMKKEGFSLNNPAYLAGAQVLAATVNIPLDRTLKKINNARNIFSESSENWQKVALALGYSTYSVGLPYYGVEDPGLETPETIRKEKEEKIKDLNKAEQVDILEKEGMSREDIKALQYEKNRVDAILKIEEEKTNPQKTKAVEVTEEKDLVKRKKVIEEKNLAKRKKVIKDMNKPEQVGILLKSGLSKKQVRALKSEASRIDAIIKIRNKKKTVEQKLRDQNKSSK